MTSLAALGLPVTMEDADVALRAAWAEVFGASGQRRQALEAGFLVGLGQVLVDQGDGRAGRAAAAGAQQLLDRGRVALNERLHRAVAAVAHPAGDAEPLAWRTIQSR